MESGRGEMSGYLLKALAQERLDGQDGAMNSDLFSQADVEPLALVLLRSARSGCVIRAGLYEEDGVQRGDCFEGLHRFSPVDGDVWASTGHRLQVALEDRGALFDGDLGEPDRGGVAMVEGAVALGGADVAHPVAVAEHRDEVPVVLPVSHAQRDAHRRTSLAARDLEGDPAAGWQAETEHGRPEPGVPLRGGIAAAVGVHVPEPLVVAPGHP